MLDVMRRHAQSWVIKGVFAIIIIVFVLFWSDPGQQGTGLQVVAVVDGSKITMTEYSRSYENLMAAYRNIFKEGLSEEMLKMMKIKEKALDNLIESRLLLSEAERLGLKVSDVELIDSVSRYPAFQKENTFDKAQYLAVLRANRLTPDEFEEGQRRSLLAGNVEDLIKEGVKVGDDEVWDAYAAQKEKVNVDLIKIEPKSFLKEVKVSEGEAKDFFSKNKDTFKLPALVKTEFITMNSQDVEKTITPSEDELRKYYEKNIDLFKKPEKDGGAKPFEEVLGQVAVLYRREKTDEVLRERVYKVGEDAVNAKGLEDLAVKEKMPLIKTGFFGFGDTVEGIGANPEFYREAFTLKAGEISQPVKTPAGYVILKVVERREPRIPEYEEAKEKAYAATVQKKAEETAFKKGEEMLAGLRNGKLNISKLPYKPSNTGLFGRGGSVPNAGPSEEMNKAAFSLTKDSPYPAKPFVINNITYIMRLKEKVEADIEGLKAEEGSIRERLRQQKGEEALKSWLKIARTKAKVKTYEELLQ
ncbi:MAG: SurA N-terminal domain-containing protein [Deltaproteobacteria bacterium]|nr:SurA N-terminal domain-containing protein [Deltaproteobacteria bacterium]